MFPLARARRRRRRSVGAPASGRRAPTRDWPVRGGAVRGCAERTHGSPISVPPRARCKKNFTVGLGCGCAKHLRAIVQ